jgi:hypothetical protein
VHAEVSSIGVRESLAVQHLQLGSGHCNRQHASLVVTMVHVMFVR